MHEKSNNLVKLLAF